MSHLKTMTRKVQEKDVEALKNNGLNLSISIVLGDNNNLDNHPKQ